MLSKLEELQVSHPLLGYRVKPSNWSIERYSFASDEAQRLCSDCLREKSWNGIKGILRVAMQHKALGKSPASIMLEDYCFDYITGGTKLDHRPLGGLRQGRS